MTPVQELEQRLTELDFASAMSALSIIRRVALVSCTMDCSRHQRQLQVSLPGT